MTAHCHDCVVARGRQASDRLHDEIVRRILRRVLRNTSFKLPRVERPAAGTSRLPPSFLHLGAVPAQCVGALAASDPQIQRCPGRASAHHWLSQRLTLHRLHPPGCGHPPQPPPPPLGQGTFTTTTTASGAPTATTGTACCRQRPPATAPLVTNGGHPPAPPPASAAGLQVPTGQLLNLEAAQPSPGAPNKPPAQKVHPRALSRRLLLRLLSSLCTARVQVPTLEISSIPPPSPSPQSKSPFPPNPLRWSRHHHPRSSVAAILVPLPLSLTLRLGPSLYNPPFPTSRFARPPRTTFLFPRAISSDPLRYPPCVCPLVSRGSGVSLFFSCRFWATFALSLLDDRLQQPRSHRAASPRHPAGESLPFVKGLRVP